MNTPEFERLDVRLLRILLVLLTEQSVSKAALMLDMTQPAMSHVLGRLRVLFQDPLLIRSRSGMVCTDRGLEMATGAREILARLDQLVTREASFDASHSRRVFIVTAVPYGEHVILPGVLRRMQLEAPHARLEVRLPPLGHTYDLLEQGEVDMRIAWGRGSVASSLRAMPLFTDRIVCVRDRAANPASPLTVSQYLQASHLRSHNTATTAKLMDGVAAQHGTTLRIAAYVQSYHAIPKMLQGTHLLATMPDRIARDLVAGTDLEICSVPLRLPPVKMMAYWHERNHSDHGHRWFRKLFSGAAGELRADAHGDKFASKESPTDDDNTSL